MVTSARRAGTTQILNASKIFARLRASSWSSDEMWCGARFGYTADCGCCDPQTGNACPQCGSQSWGWFATAPNNSLITARDAGTEESYALDWESRLAALYPLPLEGLQGRIHCIDLLGDGFFLGSQSLDAGQLLIDAKLALRQLSERRLQVLFNASVWCRASCQVVGNG